MKIDRVGCTMPDGSELLPRNCCTGSDFVRKASTRGAGAPSRGSACPGWKKGSRRGVLHSRQRSKKRVGGHYPFTNFDRGLIEAPLLDARRYTMPPGQYFAARGNP